MLFRQSNDERAQSASTEHFSVEPLCHHFLTWIYTCKYQYIYIYIYLHVLGEHRPASYATTARDNGDQAESASTEYFSVEPLCHIFFDIYIYLYIYVCVSISQYTHLYLHSSIYIYVYIYMHIYI